MQESGCVRDSINIITARGKEKDLCVQEAATSSDSESSGTPRSTGEMLQQTSSPDCLKHTLALLRHVPIMESWTIWGSHMGMGEI